MGEQEKQFGAELAHILWPRERNRRDVTSIYFISKSIRTVEVAEALVTFSEGRKVPKRALKAASALLSDIRETIKTGQLPDESLENTTQLADQLERIAISPQTTPPEVIDARYIDMLTGIAEEALATSSLVRDRHGCFGELPQRHSSF